MKAFLIEIWMIILSLFGLGHHVVPAPISTPLVASSSIPSTTAMVALTVGIPSYDFQACVNEVAGASCTVTINDKQQTGVCIAVDSTTTACAPHVSNTSPTVATSSSLTVDVPAEDIQACVNTPAGAACTVTIDNKTQTGVCIAVDSTTTACALHISSPVSRIATSSTPTTGVPAEDIQACVNTPAGAECTVTINNKTQTGVCMAVDSATNACALLGTGH